MLDHLLAEHRPLLAGLQPGATGFFEEAFFLDRLGIIHLRLGRAGIEIARALAAQALALLVDRVDRAFVPFLADEPVVAFVGRAVGRMKVVVLLEQPAVLHILVGPADFLADEPAQVPEQLRIVDVVVLAFLQEFDAAAHVVVAIVVVVELDRTLYVRFQAWNFQNVMKFGCSLASCSSVAVRLVQSSIFL